LFVITGFALAVKLVLKGFKFILKLIGGRQVTNKAKKD